MPLTTTSYAILGLLDLREWTAYELTQQARRSLAFVWPVSESQLYAEPKRLAREELITITDRSAGPQRTRQSLAITAKGRTALRTWLATEPAAPRLQMEILVRVLFAPAGSPDDLLAALDSTRTSIQDAYDYGSAIVASYRDGSNPFPERLQANVLWMVFVHDFLRLMLDWIDFASDEVRQWRRSTKAANGKRLDALLTAILAPAPILPGVG